MKYQIPKDRKVLEQEQRNLVLSAGDHEVVRIQKALGFVADYAGRDDKYEASPQEAYDALHQIYSEFQIAKEEEPYSKENFQAELEKLWRVLQLYSLLKEHDLADTYKIYQTDQVKYDNMLYSKEENELDVPEQNPDENNPFVPIDENSPYYEYVSNTAYKELQDSWMKLKNQPTIPDKLATDMEKLLSAMQLHYIRRTGTGTMFPMTSEEYAKICSLHDMCTQDLGVVSAEEKQKPEYKALHSILAQNQKNLKSLSENESLPALGNVLHGAKDPVIYLQDTKNNTAGSRMSSRETVEYVDENGKLRQGFFTPEKKRGSRKKEADALLDRYIRTYPKYKKYFEKIKQSPRIYSGIDNAADLYVRYGNKRYLMNELRTAGWVRVEDKARSEFEAIFYKLGMDIQKLENTHGVLEDSGIHEGDELAKRSQAMNDVADALGFPDLLVRSRRVTVKRGDTNIPGIMMDAAEPDTVDPRNIPDKHPFFNMSKQEFDKKEMLSSLADLQILDYICGNTDRNAYNFFLKMDFSDPAQPKLLGVQGIDNDNSFGAIKGDNVLQLAAKKNLKVITGKMAQAVKDMTPEKLEELLQPYGFHNDQVSAAKKRLNALKGMIKAYEDQDHPDSKLSEKGKWVNKKGTIFIAKEDKDWENLTLDALIPEEVHGQTPHNIFWVAESHRSELINYQEAMKEKEDLKPEKAPILNDKTLRPVRRYNKHGMKGPDLKKLEELRAKDCEIFRNAKALFDEHGGRDIDHRTREYRDMNSALNSYIEAYEKIGKALQENLETTLKERYEALEQARRNLDQSITNYDKKKHVIFLSGDSMMRLAIARKLQQTIQNKPESVKFYESAVKLQKQHQENMEKKSDSQLAAYLSEQIGSQMKNTLQNNLIRLREDDPVRIQGQKALKAQERLWNYSQTVLSDGMLSVKNRDSEGEKAEKQQVSFKRMQYEIRKKLTEKPDKNQMYEDMKTIRDYIAAQETKEEKRIEALDQTEIEKMEPEKAEEYAKMKETAGKQMADSRDLKDQINELLDKKEDITPRHVRDLLHKVYKNERSIAEQYQPKKSRFKSREVHL